VSPTTGYKEDSKRVCNGIDAHFVGILLISAFLFLATYVYELKVVR